MPTQLRAFILLGLTFTERRKNTELQGLSTHWQTVRHWLNLLNVHNRVRFKEMMSISTAKLRPHFLQFHSSFIAFIIQFQQRTNLL